VGFWQSLSVVVLFSATLNHDCDVPLKPWVIFLGCLQAYGLNVMICGCCSLHEILARLLCWWKPPPPTIVGAVQVRGRVVHVGVVRRPPRVQFWDTFVSCVGVAWIFYGLCCTIVSDGCMKTAPALYLSSKLTIVIHLVAFACVLVSVIPRLIMQRALRAGLIRTRFAAPVGSVDDQEVAAYDANTFNGETAPTECYICLQDFGASQEIRRTSCGHHFHTDCLATWFRMASSCPTCRCDLSSRFGLQERSTTPSNVPEQALIGATSEEALGA